MAVTNDILSKNVKNRVLRGVEYDNSERNEIFNKFVDRFLNLSSEDPEAFKKSFFIFEKCSDQRKKKVVHKQTSKKLTLTKRRELGLFCLGKRSLKYCDLVPLHELWKEYMADMLNLDELRRQKWTNSPEDPNFDNVSIKLYRADYHGSEMTVIRSKCCSLVGKSGIVAMETKNCFKLVGKDDIVRTIPKASSVFTFYLDEFKFTFFGKNLDVRPALRCTKKLKNVNINDL